MMKKLLLILLSVPFALAAAYADFKVQESRLYRTRDGKPASIHFKDAGGRVLYYGTYNSNALVTAPKGAVSSNIELEEITLKEKERLELTPDFWIETSKLDTNTGSVLTVKPYGYAVSIPVPAEYTILWKRTDLPTKEEHSRLFSRVPTRIWFDSDMNYISIGDKRPENAAFFRVYCPAGPHNNEMALGLDPAFKPNAAPETTETPAAAQRAIHPGEIVLSADCDMRERFAAMELARIIELITHKRIPIVSIPTKGSKFSIFIGRKFAEKLFPDDIKALEKTEGFALRKRGNNIYAFGAVPRGSLYAIAKLIEDNSDFIFFRPDEKYGYSFTPLAEMKFDNADLRTKPAFALRTWSGPGGNDYSSQYLWAIHNFVSFAYPVRGGLFNAYDYRRKELGHYVNLSGNYMELPFSIEEKDEYYPMIDGIRRKGSRVGQPCYSNPEVRKNTITAVKRIMSETPEELDFFAFDYSDSWVCCECPECMKPIELPQGGVLAPKSVVPQTDPHFRSTRTYMIANEIAQAVEETRPGTPTLILAYIYTAANPSVAPHKSLKIIFASYDTSNMRWPLRDQTGPAYYAPESWAYRYKKWIEDAPEGMGTYEYFFTSIPAMFAEAAAENMKDIASQGGWRWHSQTQPDNANKSLESYGTNATMWDINAMDQYIISRLSWDPYQDVSKLRSEFLRRVYRNAAPEMEEFYKLFGRKWFDRECKTFVNCHTGAGNVYTEFIIKAKIEKDLYSLIDKAKEKTNSPAAKQHLERKAAALRQMKESTGRSDIPRIDELAGEWTDAGSPHWNRALEFKNFRLPFDSDWSKNFAEAKTDVKLGADQKYLYFRVETDAPSTASKNTAGTEENPNVDGDRVELRFKSANKDRIFMMNSAGAYSDMENWDYAWDSNWDVKNITTKSGWGAVGRIPLQTLREKPDSDIRFIFLRTTDKGELSFARSESNRSLSFPSTVNDVYSILGVDIDSVFDEALNAKVKELPAKKYSEIPAQASFPVVPGKAYKITFEAKTSRIYVPNSEWILHEAAWSKNDMFWRWQIEFTDKNEKKTRAGSAHKNVITTNLAPYTDYFIAPENSASASLVFLPPAGRYPAALEFRNIKMEEHDLKGALNLNSDFSADAVRSAWEHTLHGAGMRTVNGKRVFDTGYGVMTSTFPLEPGKKYVLKGHRSVYGWYTAYEVLFIGKDGKWIKWTSRNDKNEDFVLRFVAPEETAKGLLRIYSSYLDWCRVEEDIPENAE